MKLEYDNSLEELDKIAQDLKIFGAANYLSDETVHALNLCLDEIFTNIVSYGLKNQNNKSIIIDLQVDNGFVTARIEDEGVPFNPLKDSPKADIKSSVEERPIGGLGVYFLEKFMDDVSYRNENGKNVLVLQKRN